MLPLFTEILNSYLREFIFYLFFFLNFYCKRKNIFGLVVDSIIIIIIIMIIIIINNNNDNNNNNNK